MSIGACPKCKEGIHYKYPCKCRREGEYMKVITLCGSTKYKDEFNVVNKNLTMLGNLVISVGVFGHAEGIELTSQEKEMLDNIHFKKIDLADEIFVINVDGYIGSSTKREIEYALSKGKVVNYLFPFIS
jgi:hypothetical protein